MKKCKLQWSNLIFPPINLFSLPKVNKMPTYILELDLEDYKRQLVLAEQALKKQKEIVFKLKDKISNLEYLIQENENLK